MTHETPEREHVLLTVLGTNPRNATYELGGAMQDARLAPLALLRLLPEARRPTRVLALCTREAKQDSWPSLEENLPHDCAAELVDLPDGDSPEDVDTFLEVVAQAVPGHADLTVDVTHGFRHFSFLTYIGVLYLAALRDVEIRGRVLRPASAGSTESVPRPCPLAGTAAVDPRAQGAVRDGQHSADGRSHSGKTSVFRAGESSGSQPAPGTVTLFHGLSFRPTAGARGTDAAHSRPASQAVAEEAGEGAPPPARISAGGRSRRT